MLDTAASFGPSAESVRVGDSRGQFCISASTANRAIIIQLEHATPEENVLLVHSSFLSLHFITEGHISEIS